MKEQYIAEIVQAVGSMSECQLSRFLELSQLATELTENQLQYILTFASKMFGSH